MATPELPTEQTLKPRYAEPRLLLNWAKNPQLKVLKMLAWVVYDREGVRNPNTLETRVDALLKAVTRNVLDEDGVTLATIKEHTLAEQGAPITATKLLQRADKADRYWEFNEYRGAVVQAYEDVQNAAAHRKTETA
ncbi:MAG TPA: hypothetical protein VNJ02_19590 [Vicinamibacterales bacterium]|nr:hypothetical protein [Vicinamibacterales bacterium]